MYIISIKCMSMSLPAGDGGLFIHSAITGYWRLSCVHGCIVAIAKLRGQHYEHTTRRQQRDSLKKKSLACGAVSLVCAVGIAG